MNIFYHQNVELSTSFFEVMQIEAEDEIKRKILTFLFDARKEQKRYQLENRNKWIGVFLHKSDAPMGILFL